MSFEKETSPVLYRRRIRRSPPPGKTRVTAAVKRRTAKLPPSLCQRNGICGHRESETSKLPVIHGGFRAQRCLESWAMESTISRPKIAKR